MNLSEQWKRTVEFANKWDERLGVSFGPPGARMKISFAKALFEVWAVLLPYLLGAQLVAVHAAHMWLWFAFLSGFIGVTAGMYVRRNVMLIAVNKGYVHLLERQRAVALSVIADNEKLLQVALAATAVRVSIELGMPPNIGPLCRYLDALGPEQNPVVN